MQSDLYPKLMDGALRFVSFRPRSAKEVREWLKRTLTRHHTTAPLVEKQIVERLSELGYVNDEKFAVWWVSQRRQATPKGAMLIRRELSAKGISKDLIEQALLGGGEEKEAARIALGKKISRWKSYPLAEQKKKAWAYLLRLGFGSNTIRTVVDDILGKEYNSDI